MSRDAYDTERHLSDFLTVVWDWCEESDYSVHLHRIEDEDVGHQWSVVLQGRGWFARPVGVIDRKRVFSVERSRMEWEPIEDYGDRIRKRLSSRAREARRERFLTTPASGIADGSSFASSVNYGVLGARRQVGRSAVAPNAE